MSGGDIKIRAHERLAAMEKKERSTIDFPYLSLDIAVDVAKAVYARSGFHSCEQDELAAQMGQVISGAFRQKTSAARSFGIIKKDGRTAFCLTDLGKRVVQDSSEKAALVEAFLAVELYSAIFDKYRGHTLPPDKALERSMGELGVSSKQTDRARQAFQKSANHAGFFDSGDNRLVRPNIRVPLSDHIHDSSGKLQGDTISDQRNVENDENDSRAASVSRFHPFIEGLLQTLPQEGEDWSGTDRVKWLKLAASAFDMIYSGDAIITISEGH